MVHSGLMPLTATDRIILIKVKIERAKKCLADLEIELTRFGNQKVYVAGADDPKFGQFTPELSAHRPLPFDALAIAGDVVHNLRTALDHLAHQLVLVGSGAEPSNRVAFPISVNLEAYERDEPGKVQGMSPETIKAIDALKPYKGGIHALWRLHSLDNIDKHRTLFTYAHDCYLVADWLTEFSPHPYLLKATSPHFAGVDDTDSDSASEEELESEIDEAVRKPNRAAADKMLPSLTQLIDYIDKLVLTFRPFLQ
jgi:hypothetical protein